MVITMKRYYPNKPKKKEINNYLNLIKSLNDKDKKGGENNVENESDNKQHR